MSRIAYVNGKYLPQRAASVNIEDRGYQFGDGVYEVVHVWGGRLIDAGLHLARLERSLAAIAIPMPLSRRVLEQVFGELMRRNRVQEGLIYMQVTRGVARREHAFPKLLPKPAVAMTIRRLPPFPRDVDAWGTAAITCPDERWQRCDIKSVNLLANVLAKEAAHRAGATEAILVDAKGIVTEGASSSVWVVDREGVLATRSLDHAVLPGCTRSALISLMGEVGITWREQDVMKSELEAAREIFLTSASSFVKPVVRLDGRPVGDGAVGPLTRALFSLFSHHVMGPVRNAPA